MTSLPLPKFTFLCGPNTPAKLELAKAIADQDDTIMVGEFETPLREATVALFFDNNLMDIDLSKSDQRTAAMPGFQQSAEDWIPVLEHTINMFGGWTLGRIALQRQQDSGMDSVFERFLYRDVRYPVDATPFLDKYCAECLLLHHGPLQPSSIGRVAQIWLPHIDTEKCLADISYDLARGLEALR